MILCGWAGCRARGQHWDDCDTADCGGCLPRRAADSSRLCQPDIRRLGEDIAALPELHHALVLIAAGAASGGEKVSSKPGPRLPNQRAVDVRHTIRNTLTTWARIVIEERQVNAPSRLTILKRSEGFIGPMPIVRQPDNSIEGVASFLGIHVGWLAAHKSAGEAAEQFADLRSYARSVAYPTGTRAFDVAPCPMDCQGTIRAVLRRVDALLPCELVCDTDDKHRWASTQWLRLGRQLRPAA